MRTLKPLFDLVKDIIRLRITDIPRIKDESMRSNFRLKKIKRTPSDLLKNKWNKPRNWFSSFTCAISQHNLSLLIVGHIISNILWPMVWAISYGTVECGLPWSMDRPCRLKMTTRMHCILCRHCIHTLWISHLMVSSIIVRSK